MTTAYRIRRPRSQQPKKLNLFYHHTSTRPVINVTKSFKRSWKHEHITLHRTTVSMATLNVVQSDLKRAVTSSITFNGTKILIHSGEFMIDLLFEIRNEFLPRNVF